VTDVGAYEFGFSAEFAEFSDELLAFLFASSRDNELRAFFRECQRGGTPDTRERAGDQDDRSSHVRSPVESGNESPNIGLPLLDCS
jgi:hypothetical protein